MATEENLLLSWYLKLSDQFIQKARIYVKAIFLLLDSYNLFDKTILLNFGARRYCKSRATSVYNFLYHMHPPKQFSHIKVYDFYQYGFVFKLRI